MDFQIPKGTFDILPYGTEEAWRLSSLWQDVESLIRQIAQEYGYQEIRTPIYERTDLFTRSVGESSDIVTKEMFSFEDKGGRSICLRPEGTAAVIRSFLENRLADKRPVHKFFYIAPMFRYERPQSGRYRQHHQFGAEAIGIKGPEQDVELIDLLFQFYKRLSIEDVIVQLNTVGDPESRAIFRTRLLDYLSPYFQDLSPESQIRFTKNPLRILDSKDPKDQDILQKAPSILDNLSAEAADHFRSVCRLLDRLSIPYQINPRIVRGLDYYSKTVFEITSQHLGAQNSLGAGGRYDGLISSFGGPDLPSVGFGTGLERVLQIVSTQGKFHPHLNNIFVYFIPIGEEAKELCFSLLSLCRHHHIPADMELQGKKIQVALQQGVKIGASYCAIIGLDEIGQGRLQLKQMATRQEEHIPFASLIPHLESLLKK